MIHSNHVNFMVLIMVVHGKRSKGVKKNVQCSTVFQKNPDLCEWKVRLFSRQQIGWNGCQFSVQRREKKATAGVFMCFKVFSALKLSTWALEVASHQPHNCIVVNVLCPAVWKIAWHFLDIFQLVLSTSWVLVSAHHCSALRITCSNWKKQILGTRANQSNLTQQSATQEAFWIFDLF